MLREKKNKPVHKQRRESCAENSSKSRTDRDSLQASQPESDDEKHEYYDDFDDRGA